MQITDNQNIESSADEWVSSLKHQGWCWFEDDKPKPHLWNHYTDSKSSEEAMTIRAEKAGIERKTAISLIRKRLPMVSGTRFLPSKPKFVQNNGCYFVNTFTSLSSGINLSDNVDMWDEGHYLPEDPALHRHAVKPFINYINRLVSNKEDFKWLMCWMAHMIQKPEERPSVHPLFRTEHGIGKNVLVEQVLNRLLCSQTVTTSLKEIRGAHSESAANNILVFVDESKAKGMNVYLELKSLLTTKEILVNPKHVRPYKQEVFSRFMFADNTEGRAFNIEQEDRRIYVMEYVIHEVDKADTQEHISEFLDWFKAHWDLVYGYLLSYDISNWSPHHCPMTDAKREYLSMCEDPIAALIEEYKATGQLSLDELRWNHLVECNGLGEDYYWVQLLKHQNLKYALEDAGFAHKRVCKQGTAKHSAYFLNGLKGKRGYDVLMRENSRTNRAAQVSENHVEPGGYVPSSQIQEDEYTV